MVRKLKYHEKKLLKKVDFISWEVDNNLHEVKIMRKYHIQRREDYTKYNRLSREIREVAQSIKDLDVEDIVRTESTGRLLDKLFHLGLVPTKENLELCNKVTASSFCRRRLPVVMVRNHMAESIALATRFIEQGRMLCSCWARSCNGSCVLGLEVNGRLRYMGEYKRYQKEGSGLQRST
ncbi:U3 small nucleolar ribonucleoprotein protein IMP3-like isoform X2 [Paramacrobiotus metropolitanus]|uniref:U3 small nucleolar ribonucleoprotein protein IMP3-like isoform X2 n=1 Tax=Paramacrobiotus metropolitanus TaxID=2943436 RepID=UPI00244621A0|nr:U3 small nucleolar ribonucleoprotein protein IMP3-like isoform X2 [Paramacrobiotus metropolitanus]